MIETIKVYIKNDFNNIVIHNKDYKVPLKSSRTNNLKIQTDEIQLYITDDNKEYVLKCEVKGCEKKVCYRNRCKKHWRHLPDIKNKNISYDNKYTSNEEVKSNRRKNSSNYYKNNPAKVKENIHKKRAILANTISDDYKTEEIIKRDNNICQICGGKIDETIITNIPYEKLMNRKINAFQFVHEHKVALNWGGTNTFDNVNTAHHICNNKRKIIEELLGLYPYEYFDYNKFVLQTKRRNLNSQYEILLNEKNLSLNLLDKYQKAETNNIVKKWITYLNVKITFINKLLKETLEKINE
jgi:hypothetical protein